MNGRNFFAELKRRNVYKVAVALRSAGRKDFNGARIGIARQIPEVDPRKYGEATWRKEADRA